MKFSCLVLIMSLFCGIMFFSCASTQKAENPKSYTIVTLQNDTEYLVAKVDYPQFLGFETLNQEISSFVSIDYTEFKKDSQENFGEFEQIWEQPIQSSYYIDSEIIESENYKSILLTKWTYSSGAAHGLVSYKTFTWNIKEGRLEDAQTVSKMSYTELSDACRSSLLREHTEFERDWVYSGTEPIPETFENFTTDEKTISIYFEPYEVAAYAAGPQIVTLKIK